MRLIKLVWYPLKLHAILFVLMFGIFPKGFPFENEFRRGDANLDGIVSISDTIAVLSYLFLDRFIDCEDAADVNDDGNLDISDAIYLLMFLFDVIDQIPDPWKMCGVDPTEDSLSCNSYFPCRYPDLYTNGYGMQFVLIPAGFFMMGSPKSERGRNEDEVLHEVRLTCDFYMMTTEVTQRQYQAIIGKNPSYYNGTRNGIDYGINLDRPAESVTWFDAVNYCQELSRLTGYKYRLPTEAEWEYSCRAGTTTRFFFGDALECIDNFCAIFCKASNDYTWGCFHFPLEEVAQKLPNQWGLFDVSGNADEWCADWYGPYPSIPVIDPKGPGTGTARVFRDTNGHGFRWLRSAARLWDDPHEVSSGLGFRVVLETHCAPD